MAVKFNEMVLRARSLAAPVGARLAMVADACKIHHPEYDAEIDRLVARLKAAEAGGGAPKDGEMITDFLLPDQFGRLWRLDRLRQRGPVIIAFHRGEWCEFCQVNMVSLAQAHPRIVEAGASLVTVAPQRAPFAKRQIEVAEATFPMLSDAGGAYAASLNLVVAIGEKVRAHMARFGIDLSETNGDEGLFLPIPATFVVAPDGRVIARHVDPDPRRRMDVDAMLQAVAAVGR